MNFYTLSNRFSRRTIAVVVGLLLVLFSVAACEGNPPPPTSDTQFTTIDLKLPSSARNALVKGPLPDNTPMHVSITFKVNQRLLDQLDRQQASTSKEQNLEDLANQLGISDSTYRQIKAFFSAEQVTLSLNKLHTTLTIDGQAKTFARLFQTHFNIYQLPERIFYAPATDAPPKLPTFIAKTVLAVVGLDSYSAPPQAGRLTSQPIQPASTAQHPARDCSFRAQIPTVPPWQVAHAYGYDRLWRQGFHGEGMTINLLQFAGFYPSDVQNYFACVHFHGQFKVVDVNAKPDQINAEPMLDIEMLAGLAPAATIVNHEGPDTFSEFNDELQQIINENTRNTSSGSIVSTSWGLDEYHETSNDIAAIDQSLQILTRAEHMTVFADTYDCAAFADGTYGDLSVSYPASDPWAVGVGGTVLTVDKSGNRANETAWSDGSDTTTCNNSWGSGGGNSSVFKRPAWQIGLGVKNRYAHGMRQLPDVSAISLWVPAYFQGMWVPTGGTSAATPIWGAGMALVNQDLIKRAGVFFYGPSIFYKVAQIGASQKLHPFYDVTRGNNLYYPAGTGWDYTTGFGTPNLADFTIILLEMAKNR